MSSSTSHTNTKKQLQIIFIHLDLGIGGAEQLVLNLAQASLCQDHNVKLITSNCRQEHCFSVVKKPNGILSENVYIWGNWIPTSICNMGTAFFSSLRLVYLAVWTLVKFPHADLIVLDVLSTPIPLLLPHFPVLFYSHFPDKLLVRNLVNGEIVDGALQPSLLKRMYRNMLDTVEEFTMSLADLLVVNSQFTRATIQTTFSSLQTKPMRVLYPALQCSLDESTALQAKTSTSPIVSLNRYERKKNVELLLKAYALLVKQDSLFASHPLIIAGGYDARNIENVEYRAELESLASELEIQVQFMQSISDETRSTLLKEALCVVYTPHLEHFGIVPLESMLAGTPVVAVHSGGPMETVINGKTGYLCEATPEAFCNALEKLASNPKLATRMGQAGRQHVVEKFSQERFQQEWLVLVQEAVKTGQCRLNTRNYTVYKSFVYILEAALVLLGVWLLTFLLRYCGILQENAHIVGSVKRALFNRKDEL